MSTNDEADTVWLNDWEHTSVWRKWIKIIRFRATFKGFSKWCISHRLGENVSDSRTGNRSCSDVRFITGTGNNVVRGVTIRFYMRASYAASRHCFRRRLCVRASVCTSVSTKSRKLLVRNRCHLVRICPIVNARSDWKLVTFDLDLWPWELFSYFSAQAIPFERLDLATSLTVWRYFLRMSTSQFSFKVIGSRSRSRRQ